MAFWGVQVKPGIPFTLQASTSKGRLHLAQATLGIGSASMKCILQCTVGNKYPVFLCSLVPEHNECCQIHVEFDEAQPVVFSVIGPRSIYITGFYQRNTCPDDESESYGEDIAMTESDRSLSNDDYDYSDDFIDDRLVVPETSSDEERPRASKPKFQRLKKKYQSPEKENTRAPNNGGVGKEEMESDSDAFVDDFFISLKKKDMKVAADKNPVEMDGESKEKKEEEAAAVESVSPLPGTTQKRKKKMKKQLEEADLETSGELDKKKKKRKKGKTNRMLEFEQGSDS